MKTSCPECGAEVEFRYDDSFVRVCSYCHAAVQRSDRGIESLGKFADLVPMESPLRLFSDGQLGSQTFILVGMAQLRHEAGGMTQEWYARFSDSWGWLAEAQGRYYMTFEVEGAQLPPLTSLGPGSKVDLPTMLGAQRTFTVAEIGRATYVAANGELPFKLVPSSSYRFVDLSDGEGNFATIDYGDGDDAPALYVGRQTALAELGITGGEVGPSRDQKISSTRLGCPNCNAPVDLYAPDQSLRAVCQHCNHLLDVQSGALRVLEKLKSKASPRIPLGSTCTFSEGKMRVIGFIGRSAEVEGTWYPFEEYLLYAPEVGFRWLVNSDGHWSYVQPIAVGAVTSEGTSVKYDGVKLRLFQNAPLRVDEVFGEVYWQVQVGEMVYGNDYVAPPAMISSESSGKEENWSLSTYLKPRQVEDAFGDTKPWLGPTTGVAPNQPDPVGAVATPLTLAFIGLLVAGIVFASMAPEIEKYSTTVNIQSGGVPPAPTAESPEPAQPNVFFSDPFPLDGGHNVELAFRSSLDNNWAFVVASLVNTGSGDVFTVDASMEHYSGVDEGESWSEGKDYASEVIGPPGAGEYVLRLESQHGALSGEVPMTVRVRQGVFRGRNLAIAIGVLGIPFLILGIFTYSFERRRWSNSTQGMSGAPRTALFLVIAAVVMLLTGIVTILKAFGSSSDDD